MRNLFRPLCLTALIAVAPTVLIGCSGGSSSSRSDSKTRADLTFNTDIAANALKPLKTRGAFKPKVISESGPFPYEGNGVYTFFDHRDGFPDETDGDLVTYIVANVNGVNRAFYLRRSAGAAGTEGDAGSFFTFQNPDFDTASFVNFEKNNNYTYVADGGRADVIFNDGQYATLQLTNVSLRSLDEGTATAPSNVSVNGTFTYKISDTAILDLDDSRNAKKADSLPAALKKSPNG